MKPLFVAAALALILAPPAFADRTFDLSGFVTWVDPNSEGTFDSPTDEIDVDLGDEMGYGASVNIFFTDRISTELSVSQVDSSFGLNARRRAVNVSDGEFNMIPITGVVQFHFAPDGVIDPYIGAGGAYIVFGDVTGDNAGNLAIDDIDSDDLGLVLNAGVGVRLGQRFGLFGDVKYIPVGSAARGVLNDAAGTETDIEISPIIVSAGIQIRF